MYRTQTVSMLLTAACAVLLTATPVLAQADDAARREAVIRSAIERYNGALAQQTSPAPRVGPSGQGGIRELRLEEAVEMALEQNLDIAVERLNPQTFDLQLAGLRNTYRPTVSSVIGRRSLYQLPTSQLIGGTQVVNATNTYNAGFAQTFPWFGTDVAVAWDNSRVFSTSNNVLYNPALRSSVVASVTQPLLRGFRIDNTRQQLLVAQISQESSEESVRGTVASTLANVRNAYWDLVFARSAVEVARGSLQLAEKLVEDNKARVEVGTLAPIDVVQADVQAANNRQTLALAEATLQTAELTLKRFLVNGTEDLLWSQEIVPVDLPSLEAPPSDVEGAVRRALSDRTDLANARRTIDSSDVSIRFFRNQALPGIDVTASYGAQGIGGVRLDRTGGLGADANAVIPGGYADALSLLTARDYPNWNLQLTIDYPLGGSQAQAQQARARIQRQQAVTRLRSLEVQVAAEVANAALTVQSNLKRVEAASAARALAEQQLDAEQSKFEVGISTNFFVVQAQRDLANAQNSELRALADYRKSLVTFERSQVTSAGGGATGASTGTGGTVTAIGGTGTQTGTGTGTGTTGTGTGTGTGGTGVGGTGTGGPG